MSNSQSFKLLSSEVDMTSSETFWIDFTDEVRYLRKGDLLEVISDNSWGLYKIESVQHIDLKLKLKPTFLTGGFSQGNVR